MTELPSTLQNLPASEFGGESFFKIADVIRAVGVGRPTAYKHLRELGIAPRKVKGSSYLSATDAIALLEYARLIAEGLQEGRSSALAAPAARGELVALKPEEPEENGDTGIVDIESLRYLEEAAQCGWWLPTGTLAVLLDVSASSIVSKGDSFIALGFEFVRANERWKGSIQWAVAKVARHE
ncbi:MAG: hypothetical protein AAFY11_13105 [Cyanobacteria bacterium J06641_5]